MTFYIIIDHSNGSQKAVAAFSSMRKAEEFKSESESKSIKIDSYEVPSGATFSTVMMYAAHKKSEDGSSDIAGYYFNIYDAENDIGKDGFIERLTIDKKTEVGTEKPEEEIEYKSYKIEAKRDRPAPPKQKLSHKISAKRLVTFENWQF